MDQEEYESRKSHAEASGTNPGELPIEGPTHFGFAINLKTAQRLSIKLSPELLQRADEVIE
jgi:putative ABC transport system substrate-binding protein